MTLSKPVSGMMVTDEVLTPNSERERCIIIHYLIIKFIVQNFII